MSLGVLEHFLINKKGERLVQETLKLLLTQEKVRLDFIRNTYHIICSIKFKLKWSLKLHCLSYCICSMLYSAYLIHLPFVYLSKRKTRKKERKIETPFISLFIYLFLGYIMQHAYYNFGWKLFLFYLSKPGPQHFGARALFLLLYAWSGPQVSNIALWLLLNHG